MSTTTIVLCNEVYAECIYMMNMEGKNSMNSVHQPVLKVMGDFLFKMLFSVLFMCGFCLLCVPENSL